MQAKHVLFTKALLPLSRELLYQVPIQLCMRDITQNGCMYYNRRTPKHP